ncbi:iron-containing alcohol dehydrogenase [Sporomusa aerivorans]
MDASKAIATMYTYDGDCWDYVHGGSGKPITNKPLPIVAITTTAGTGSEVDPYGVITHEEKNEKIGFGGIDELFPGLTIVDPELMITVPPIRALMPCSTVVRLTTVCVRFYITRFCEIGGL